MGYPRFFSTVFSTQRWFGVGVFLLFSGMSVQLECSQLQASPRGSIMHVQQQKKLLLGVVSDIKGDPLPGAVVRVKERPGAGATTNQRGEYRIELQPGDKTIIVSLVGMKTQEIKIGDRSKIDIKLQEAVDELSEVVVTGIFTKAKESYTGSVSTISKEDLKTYRAQNLVQTLKNIDASINFPINNIVGSDPNQLPNIRIRGNSSLPSIGDYQTGAMANANMPLIIMDGFEIPIQKLMDYNEEEIESINILKDASATAIYGSRGANGVIVIVTRQPEAGKLKVSATAGLNLELPDISSYHLLDSRGKLEVERLAGLYNNPKRPTRQIELDRYYDERLRTVLSGVDTDWLRVPLQTGVGQRYNVRLEGGSREFRWSTGVNYNNVTGAVKESSRNSFSGDITLAYYVSNLIFRNNTSISNVTGENSKYGSFQKFVDQQPYDPIYDKNGKLVRYYQNLDHSALKQNPLYDAQLNSFDINKDFSVTNNFTIDWTPMEGLRSVGRLGISKMIGRSDVFLPAEHSKFIGNEFRTAEGILRRGTYQYGTRNSFTLDGNVTTSYSKVFAEKHNLYAGVDFSVAETRSESVDIKAEGFTNQDLNSLGNALQYEKGATPRSYESIGRRVGFTGNLNYIYDNRYYVDASYRIDGSSQFGSNRRFAPFWSAGAGWNIHNEQWAKPFNSKVNLLRLKGSVGAIGSIDYDRNSVITSYTYPSGYRYLAWNGGYLTRWGNPDLTWQTTHMLSGGIEFGFFQNRINGRVEFYNKLTDALTSRMDLPLAKGFSSYDANIGEVLNYGVETYLNIYLFRDFDREFNWLLGGQLVYDQSRITKLSDTIKAQTEEAIRKGNAVDYLYEEGRPVTSIYAVRSLGIDPAYGNEIFLDKNGNPTTTYNPAAKVFIGDGSPKFRGIVNSTLNWKGLSFNISGTFHWGGWLFNSTLQQRVEVTPDVISAINVDDRVLSQRWHNPNDAVFFQNFESNYNNQATSRYVMRDNVFEIQSINLRYRWDNEWLRNTTKLNSMTFSVNMNNIAYFSSIRQERGTAYPFARNVVASLSLIY